MTWLFIALFTAFSLSTADALSKKALTGTSELTVVWVRQGYAVPFLAAGLLLIDIPPLDATFFWTVCMLLPLEVAAMLLYVRAINISPLSLTIPFLAITPVFIIAIAFVVLGEVPGPLGAAGVATISIGAYLLNAGARKRGTGGSRSNGGILGPFRAITRERGSVLMIIVAFIYAITSTLGKVAIQHSEPVFFGLFYPVVLTTVITVPLIVRGQVREAISRPGIFAAIGFFSAAMIVTHFIALGMTDVAYMISVKRTSLLFSVVYGRVIFGEEHTAARLIGAGIMVAGVAMIALD